MFEGSPKCIHKGMKGKVDFFRWSRSSMVIGACIEGIGNTSKHLLAPRNRQDKKGRPQGPRKAGFGEQYNFKNVLDGNNGYYLLYNGADFRRMSPGIHIYGGTGFHFHNFFDSIEKLRFKYRFYGHVHTHAFSAPLMGIDTDLTLLVRCMRNMSDDGNRKQRLTNGLDILAETFELPVLFQVKGYVDARHEEVKFLIKMDEEEYGRADNFTGHHIYRDNMLTHPGRRHIQILKN